MVETNDFALKNDDGSDMATVIVTAGASSNAVRWGSSCPPSPPAQLEPTPVPQTALAHTWPYRLDNGHLLSDPQIKGGSLQNNYTRQGGQNVGNMISDRPSSRVMHAPGGSSSVSPHVRTQLCRLCPACACLLTGTTCAKPSSPPAPPSSLARSRSATTRTPTSLR
jgi:SPIRAL1-like protein